MEIFKLFGSILVDNSKANDSISKTDGKAKGLMGSLGGGIKTAAKWGAGIVAAAGSAAIAIGGVATKAAMDFEKQMSNVATLLDGDVKSKIENLGVEIKNLSTDTGVSTELLTDGLYQVISAFGETADSMDILSVASKGAKAGNATVTDSVNLLAAVTKGYGDTSAEAANKASDLAFLTVKLGQTSFPELASSMGKVIPLASTMKVSQEELFGAMATLTGVTGNTAEVSTQLRATIQGMLQPTTAMAGKIKDLGYENGQAMIESLGLQGTLDKLKDSVGGNEIAFSELFGSVEAKNAVLALTGAQAENFTEKTNAMKDAVGATDEAFKKQTDNVKDNFAKLKNTFDVMMIDLGEKFLPILNDLLKWINDKMPIIQDALWNMFDGIDVVVDGFKKAIDEFKACGEPIEFIYTLFDEIFGVQIPNKVLWFVDEFIYQFKWMWETLKESWDTIAVPIFDAFKRVFDVIKEHSDTILEGFTDLFATTFEIIRGAWDSIGKPIFDFIVEAIGWVADAFAERVPLIVEFFSTMVEDIRLFWENNLKPCFDAIGGFITNVLAPAFEKVFKNIILPIVDACFKGIKDLWSNSLKPILEGVIDFITGVFSGSWSTAWEGLKNIVSGVFGGLVSVVKAPINAIIGMVNRMIEGINTFQVPEWVPIIGGKGVNIPTIPMLAKGTDYFQGGVAIVGEEGPELVEMPRGARVNTASKTKEKLNGGNTYNFYSNEKLSEREILRQQSNLERRLSLGLA